MVEIKSRQKIKQNDEKDLHLTPPFSRIFPQAHVTLRDLSFMNCESTGTNIDERSRVGAVLRK